MSFAASSPCRRSACRVMAAAQLRRQGQQSSYSGLTRKQFTRSCHALSTSTPSSLLPRAYPTHSSTLLRTTILGNSNASFSAAAASSTSDKGTGTNSSNQQQQQNQQKQKSKADEPNIFLDNIGKIFLGAIGGIIAMLVRSSRATTNRTALRDYIENHALLDPLEIDDLRVANSELTAEVFAAIMRDVYAAFPGGRASYEDFVSVVMMTMRGMKGDAFTIQLGHLIDRVAIAAVEREVELEAVDGDDSTLNSGSGSSSTSDDVMEQQQQLDRTNPIKRQLPLPLLVAVLSLALHDADVSDRVRLLFEAMERDASSGEEGKVSESDIVKMIDYLQRTCQLVPDAQIVQTETKYPVQGYRKGTPEELVGCAKKLMADEGLWEEANVKTTDNKYDRAAFHRILRTKQVCAWGECYRKTKNLE